MSFTNQPFWQMNRLGGIEAWTRLKIRTRHTIENLMIRVLYNMYLGWVRLVRQRMKHFIFVVMSR